MLLFRLFDGDSFLCGMLKGRLGTVANSTSGYSNGSSYHQNGYNTSNVNMTSSIGGHNGGGAFSSPSTSSTTSTPGFSNSSNSPVVSFPKVILFGDSLTQKSMHPESNWGALVADFLARKCDVIVRGFSGYNSRKALTLLPYLFDGINFKNNVAALLICLGTNDASAGQGNESHVPEEEFVENMLMIGEYFTSRGLNPSKIIMTGPPGFHAPAWADKARAMGIGDHIRTNELNKKYSALVTEVSKHLKCRNIPLHTRMMATDNWEEMLIDGLHFGPLGAQFYFNLLQPHLSHLTYDIPQLMPNWKDFDAAYGNHYDHPEEVVERWAEKNSYFVR